MSHIFAVGTSNIPRLAGLMLTVFLTLHACTYLTDAQTDKAGNPSAASNID